MHPTELLRLFDDWEYQTRGLRASSHRVAIEPPFSPLFANERAPKSVLDDGRRPVESDQRSWGADWRGHIWIADMELARRFDSARATKPIRLPRADSRKSRACGVHDDRVVSYAKSERPPSAGQVLRLLRILTTRLAHARCVADCAAIYAVRFADTGVITTRGCSCK